MSLQHQVERLLCELRAELARSGEQGAAGERPIVAYAVVSLEAALKAVEGEPPAFLSRPEREQAHRQAALEVRVLQALRAWLLSQAAVAPAVVAVLEGVLGVAGQGTAAQDALQEVLREARALVERAANAGVTRGDLVSLRAALQRLDGKAF